MGSAVASPANLLTRDTNGCWLRSGALLLRALCARPIAPDLVHSTSKERIGPGSSRGTMLVRPICALAIALTSCARTGGAEPSGPETGLAIVTSSLPTATVGVGYAAELVASGGTAPVSWSVPAGTSLPPGLALDAAVGAITGTPTMAGSYQFAVEASDSADPPHSATATVSVTIHPAFSVTTTSLPDATVSIPYAETLAAADGTQPYRWSVVGGFLPPGITLAENGTLSGTPSTRGSYSVRIGAVDSSTPPQVATLTAAIHVGPDAGVEITTGSLPWPTLASAYSATLTASGGTAPYAWTVAAGELPPGLSLGAAGTISGIAAMTGSYSFVAQVADVSSPSDVVQRTFTLAVLTAPLRIGTVSLPSGAVGVHYDYALVASGGTTPYTWSVGAGSLPPGLALNPDTSVIEGFPTANGTYAFTLQATDSSTPVRTASHQFEIKVASASNALEITTTSFPDGVVGVPYGVAVSAMGGLSQYFWWSTSLPPGLGFDSWWPSFLDGTPTVAGTFNFTLHVSDLSVPAHEAAAPFTIKVHEPIRVTSPMGVDGVSLPAGVEGVPYSGTIEVAGGLPSYAFSLVSGSLPPGLSLAESGALTGTPARDGTWGFSVQVSDSANPQQSVTVDCWIAISSAPQP